MNTKTYKQAFVVLAVSIFIVPQIAFAAWWNPLSWSIWNIFRSTPQEQVQIATTTIPTALATTTEKADTKVVSPKKPVVDSTQKVSQPNIKQPSVAVPSQPIPTSVPSCTQDTWSCSDWLACSSSGSQPRSCSKTFECPSVVTQSPITSQSCTPPAPSCQTDTWSCGDWNTCSASGNQTRSCTKTFDCSSANTPSPESSQSCTPPIPSQTQNQNVAQQQTTQPAIPEPSYNDLHCPKVIRLEDNQGNVSNTTNLKGSLKASEVNTLEVRIIAEDPNGDVLKYYFSPSSFLKDYPRLNFWTENNSYSMDGSNLLIGGNRTLFARIDDGDSYSCIGANYDVQIWFTYDISP